MEGHVVRAETIVQPEGLTRGWAQADFEEVPEHLRLDFAPLRLFGQGSLHPGEGFAMHRHEGIENILLTRAGRMHHQGSDGSDWILGPDDVFLMSAGTGAEHAELVEGDESVDAVVIWLQTNAPTAEPLFARGRFDCSDGGLVPIASGGALRSGGLAIRCSAAVLRAELDAGGCVQHVMPSGGRTYVAVLEGTVTAAGHRLGAADRLMLAGAGPLRLSSDTGASVVIVQMLEPS